MGFGHLRKPGWSRLRWTLILAGILVFVATGTVFAVNGFSDVPATHTHYEGINWVAEKGITTGYPDGTYRPDNPVTRGQMATFLHRNAGVLVAAGATVVDPVIITLPTAVDRWFNNVNGQQPTFVKNGSGQYELDFGFDVSDRFVQVTAVPTGLIVLPGTPQVRWATATVSGTKVRVWTYYFDGASPQLADCNVHILIY